MKSTAKSTASARSLKDTLQQRGFAVVESQIANGSKLTLDGDAISIRIEAKDNGIKDIFGSDNFDFAPHELKLSVKDATSYSDVIKAFMEVAKQGFAIKIGNGASIGAAETAADSAEELQHNSAWPTKGA